MKFHMSGSHEWKNVWRDLYRTRAGSQSDTSLYQSVFANKIRVGFFRSKHTGSDSIIDDYVLQMWETFQLSRGTQEVEHKDVDGIIEEDKNIRGDDRHCKNCKKQAGAELCQAQNC